MHRSASHGEYTNHIDASSSPPEDCSSIKAHHCCAPIIGNFITKALCLQEEKYRAKMMSFSLKCIDFFHCPIYFLHGYQDLCQRLVSSRAELDRWHRFTFQYDNFGLGGSDKKTGSGCGFLLSTLCFSRFKKLRFEDNIYRFCLRKG